jgi:outer membrane lipoprotein-sorting protein
MLCGGASKRREFGIIPAGYASHTGYQYDAISRVAGHRELAPPSNPSKDGGFNSNVFMKPMKFLAFQTKIIQDLIIMRVVFSLAFFSLVFAIFTMSSIVAESQNAPLTPAETLKAMRASFSALSDYTCVLSNVNFGKPSDDSESDYFFKKPKLLKLVGVGGKSKGAVVLLDKSGKAHLKKSGFPIPGFLIREALNDFAMSDFGSLIDEMAHNVAIGEARISEETPERIALEIQLKAKTQRYFIDKKLMLPVELIESVNGKETSKTQWKNLKLNVNLEDSLFRP